MGLFSQDEPAPQAFELAGRRLTCDHCQQDTFFEGEAQLNTQGMTLLGLDWANRSATYFRCATCGKLHWFLLGE